MCKGLGAILSCLPQGNVIKCLWGMWTGAWELALVKTDTLLEKRNSWHLIVNLIFSIRFRGVSQALHTTDITAFQRAANLTLIFKSAFTNWGNLGANFPHHITIETQVAFILHGTLQHVIQKLEWCSFFQNEIAQQSDVPRAFALNYRN